MPVVGAAVDGLPVGLPVVGAAVVGAAVGLGVGLRVGALLDLFDFVPAVGPLVFLNNTLTSATREVYFLCSRTLL